MVTATDALAPLVHTDLDRGGRWTSLRVGGREWLWQRDAPARDAVGPGDSFVDAGGLEECIPTVRGIPDHGLAWSRRWRRSGDTDTVDCGDFVLARRLALTDGGVVADYHLTAEPGYRFVWAAHALLDLGCGATISLPDGAPVRLYPEAAPFLDRDWPTCAPYVAGAWPEPGGVPLSELGPDDGTALGASVLGINHVAVIDGDHRLTMLLDAGADVPVSIALWRNLGGYPPDAPYRSIGVEPMLGTVFDLADAGPGDAAVVPQSSSLHWRLHITGSEAS